MNKRERSRKKHRAIVKEKMDKSIKAAEIYNQLTEANNSGHHHSLSRAERKKQKKKNNYRKLVSCFYMPVVYALIFMVIFSACGLFIFSKYGDFITEHFSFSAPNYSQDNIPVSSEINSDITHGVVMFEKEMVPEKNENYAKIKCDKLNKSTIDIFYDASILARNKGAVQKNDGVYFGFSGCKVIYAYHQKFFTGIDKLTQDDLIEIQTNYGKFVYKVTSVFNAKSSKDFSNEEQDDTIVLYTERFSSITDDIECGNIYVFAKLVSGPIVMR